MSDKSTSPSLLAEFRIQEPLSRNWPAQWIRFQGRIPSNIKRHLILVDPSSNTQPEHGIQRLNESDGWTDIAAHVYTDLPADSTRVWQLVESSETPAISYFKKTQKSGGMTILASGLVEVRVPSGSFKDETPPPLYSIRRPGGPWLGEGVMQGLGKISSVTATTDESDPHAIRHTVRYELAGGEIYTVTLTLVAHEPSLLVEENFLDVHEGAFVFDLRPGLEPVQGHWRTHRTNPAKSTQKAAAGVSYIIDYNNDEDLRLQPFFSWWTDYAVWWAGFRPGGEYLGLFTTQPSRWTNPPPNVIHIKHGPPDAVRAELPLMRGTRTWGFLVLPQAEAQMEPGLPQARIQQQIIRHTENNLDRVKDLVLSCPGAQHADYPHLLCRPEDVPSIRKKTRTQPDFSRVLEQFPENPDDDAGLYLATGDETHAAQAIIAIKDRLRNWVEDYIAGEGYNGGGLVCIGMTRPFRAMACAFDLVAGSQSMTPEDRDYCLRAIAFLCYCRMDENHWPARDQGFSRGNINFHSDHYASVATAAALLVGHPERGRWMDYVKREMDYEFETSVFPGGAWVEAPNYQGFTMHYLLIAIRAMQLNGYHDYAKEPALRDTMRFLYHLQTPRDVRSGWHLLPTIGDTTSSYHSQSLQSIFAWMATLSQDDPAFSRLMMDGWRRSGSIMFGAHSLGLGQGWTQPLTLIDPTIPSAAPETPLQSEVFSGYGAILRNHWNTPEETYFFFKSGQIGQHFDTDEGSIHWYAKGIPVSLDFGSMYEPSIGQPWLHSTLSVDHRAPWTRGEITSFITIPGVDYVASELAVNDLQTVKELPESDQVDSEIERGHHFVYWKRQVLLVRGPDYIVLRDDTDDADDTHWTDWSLQVLADEVVIQGQQARFKGQLGMDLEVAFAEPADAELTHRTWGYPARDYPDWVMPVPPARMSETQIGLHTKAPVDGSYLALLFPYRHKDESPPEILERQPGALRFRYNQGEDTVLFARNTGTIKSGDITYAGRVGVFRRTEGKFTAQIIEGVSFRIPEGIFQIPGPCSVEISHGHLRVITKGRFRSAFIHWSPPPRQPAVLTIDGKEKPVYHTFDGYLQFEIEEGEHEIEVMYPKER